VDVNETNPSAILLGQIEDQIAWYSHKSKRYKTIDLFSQLTLLALSLIIPFLITCGFENTKYIVAFFSTLVGFIEGFRSIVKCKEKWISYRSTLQSLKHEFLLYKTSTGIYSCENDKTNLLSERYLLIIDSEHREWQECVTKKKGKSNG
jgi:hypothetical protein